MQFFALGAALMALLFPSLSLAQCPDDEWYATTSARPQGIVGGSPQNQTLLRSEFDQSYFLVLEYYNTLAGIEELFISEANVQPIPCERGKGIIVQKYGDDGELHWHKNLCYSINGLVDGIAADDSGNLYLGGYFKGDLIYDVNLISQSEEYIAYFLMKLNNQGNIAWVKTSEKSGAVGLTWTDSGLMVMLTVSDSITYNGTTYHHPAPTIPLTRDFVLFMLDGEGEYVWHRFISGSKNEQIHHVAYSNGQCLIQGRFEENITYDGQTLSGSQLGRLFQLSFQSVDGEHLWMKNQLNDGTAVLTYGAEFLDDGTFVSSGFYNGSPSTFAFQGETVTSSNGLTDGYVMRQDFQTGDLIWLKTLGAAGYSGVLGMDRTSTGVVLTGFFDSPELNYEGITLTNHNDDTEDAFIIIIDKDGKPQCQISGIGTESYDRGVKVVHDSNYLYTLISYSDSTTFGDFELEAQGLKDIALWKTCLPCDTLTSIAETANGQASLNLYPNPFSTQTQLNYRSPQGTRPKLQLRDLLGRMVQTVQLPNHEGTYTLDAAGLGAGVYFCSLLSGSEVLATEKLSVIRNE